MLLDVAKFLIHFDTDRGSLRALIYYRKRSFMCLKNHKVCNNKKLPLQQVYLLLLSEMQLKKNGACLKLHH